MVIYCSIRQHLWFLAWTCIELKIVKTISSINTMSTCSNSNHLTICLLINHIHNNRRLNSCNYMLSFLNIFNYFVNIIYIRVINHSQEEVCTHLIFTYNHGNMFGNLVIHMPHLTIHETFLSL